MQITHQGKNFTKIKEEFIAKYGQIVKQKEANELLAICRVPGENYYKDGIAESTPPIFNGAFWTTGYHNDKSDPGNIDDWEGLDEALTIANEIKMILKNQEEKTSASFPYLDFVLPTELPQESFLEEFIRVIGNQIPLENSIKENVYICVDKTEITDSIFFYDVLSTLAGDEKLEDYYTQEQILDYRRADAYMSQNLKNIRQIHVGGIKIAPVFFVGQTPKGYLAGVFSLQSTTV